MYNAFYGLQENPFDITPDSKFLFWSQKHQTAFRHLLYSVQSRKGLVLLTGEVGTGKTTLLNALIEFVKESEVKTRIVYLVNSKFNADDLFRYIFNELGLKIRTEKRSDYWITLKNFLLECSNHGERTLLILDESQNYAPDVLEEVRLLSNLETSEGKLLQIILAGQTQLMSNVNKPELYQLKQRIGISYNLQSLNHEETQLYIKKRLEVAGAKDVSIFNQDAIEAIHNYSRGIPRVINILCDNALLFGYATKKNQIGGAIVRQVAENMDLEDPYLSNSHLREAFVSDQRGSEEIYVEREDVSRYSFTKEKENYRRRDIDPEITSDHLDYRQFHYGGMNREGKSRKRFVWLVQLALVSIIILGIVFLAKGNFFVRAENLIHVLFPNASSPRDNPRETVASEGVSEGSRHPNRQPEGGESRSEMSQESMGNLSSRVAVTAPAAPEEMAQQENPVPLVGLGDEKPQFSIVQAGDTFRDIILKKYGTYNRTIVNRVLSTNPEIQDVHTILIGQRIVLPEL